MLTRHLLQSGRSPDTRVFAVLHVFKRQTQIMAQHASAEYQSISYQRASWLNASTAVAVAAVINLSVSGFVLFVLHLIPQRRSYELWVFPIFMLLHPYLHVATLLSSTCIQMPSAFNDCTDLSHGYSLWV
eukprot:m.352943 g.352943  ORF g.352943 m.352943 type:complete len:130 (-) comp16650_c0_seq1:85-474(-)